MIRFSVTFSRHADSAEPRKLTRPTFRTCHVKVGAGHETNVKGNPTEFNVPHLSTDIFWGILEYVIIITSHQVLSPGDIF